MRGERLQSSPCGSRRSFAKENSKFRTDRLIGTSPFRRSASNTRSAAPAEPFAPLEESSALWPPGPGAFEAPLPNPSRRPQHRWLGNDGELCGHRARFCPRRLGVLFLSSSGAFSLCVICFETARAGDNGNSEATNDHGAGSAVQDNPSRNSGKEIHNNSNALDRLIGISKSKLRRHRREDYKSLRPKLRGRRTACFGLLFRR